MPARIKKGDRVVVLSGKDKGREGKIISIFSKEERALVEGINLRKKHQRPRRAGEKGKIIELPLPVALSKLMPKCPHCQKPVRVGTLMSGAEKKRVCKKCGGEF